MDKHAEAMQQPQPPPYSEQAHASTDPAPYPVPPAYSYPEQSEKTPLHGPPQQAQYAVGPGQPLYPGQQAPYPGPQSVPPTQHVGTQGIPPTGSYPPGPGQPGAPLPPGGHWQQTPQGPVYVTQTTTTVQNNNSHVDSSTFRSLRTAIPELPMGLAITLCVVNCILPGIGTIIAGFSVFCCGNPGQSSGGKFGTFCINFWIGIAQLLFVFFIVGWIWSIMWGVAFIAISDEGSKKRSSAGQTTTTVVTTTQPMGYSGGSAPPQHPDMVPK